MRRLGLTMTLHVSASRWSNFSAWLTFVKIRNARGGIEQPAPEEIARLCNDGEGDKPCKRPHSVMIIPTAGITKIQRYDSRVWMRFLCLEWSTIYPLPGEIHQIQHGIMKPGVDLQYILYIYP